MTISPWEEVEASNLGYGRVELYRSFSFDVYTYLEIKQNVVLEEKIVNMIFYRNERIIKQEEKKTQLSCIQ